MQQFNQQIQQQPQQYTTATTANLVPTFVTAPQQQQQHVGVQQQQIQMLPVFQGQQQGGGVVHHQAPMGAHQVFQLAPQQLQPLPLQQVPLQQNVYGASSSGGGFSGNSIGYSSTASTDAGGNNSSGSGGGAHRNLATLGSAINFGEAPMAFSQPRVGGAKLHPQPQGLPPQHGAAGPMRQGMQQQQQQQGGQQGPPPPQQQQPAPTAPPQRVVKKVSMLHADVLPIPDPADQGPKQLIVNYIAPQVKITELFALFEQFGPLECAKILLDSDGVTKGFGFVYYGSSADAATALSNLQSFEFYGKYLRLGYAVPQRAPPVKD